MNRVAGSIQYRTGIRCLNTIDEVLDCFNDVKLRLKAHNRYVSSEMVINIQDGVSSSNLPRKHTLTQVHTYTNIKQLIYMIIRAEPNTCITFQLK